MSYPPRYTWRTRDCDSVNHEVINIDMDNFDWEKAFSVANVHTQVKLFNETLTSIFMKFVPNKLLLMIVTPLR